MVELLGTHCEYPDCHTLDFLPIHCIHCSKTYCKKHGSAPDHFCPSLVTTDASSNDSSTATTILLPCAHPNGCKNQKSSVNFTCSLCLKNYCVEHRHQDDHHCPNRTQSTITHETSHGNKAHVQATSNYPAEKFMGTKNESLAMKVALMKLKQTARGPPGVPMENRRHLFVEVEEEGVNRKRYPFYLSTLWPLGKGLDYLDKELKLLPARRTIILERERTELDLSTNIGDLKQLRDADVIILRKN